MFAPMISRRLGASLASRRVIVPTVLRATMVTTNKDEHNPEGPMLGGYTEFLDDMIAKTEQMEQKMDSLKATYAKKQEKVMKSDTVKWMDPAEIEALFDLAGTQKREMEEQLKAMKAQLKAAHTNFAVDAPDGFNDGDLEDEMEEVNHIIEDQAKLNKAAKK